MTTVSRAKPDIGQYFLVYDPNDHDLHKSNVLKHPMHWSLWKLQNDVGGCDVVVHWNGARNDEGVYANMDSTTPFCTYPLTDIQAAGLIMRSVHTLTRARWHEICHEMTGVEP